MLFKYYFLDCPVVLDGQFSSLKIKDSKHMSQYDNQSHEDSNTANS
jgi:hypothetical protein